MTGSKRMGSRRGALEGTTSEFISVMMQGTTFDWQYDFSAIRELGFPEKVDAVMGYQLAFDRMRKANITP